MKPKVAIPWILFLLLLYVVVMYFRGCGPRFGSDAAGAKHDTLFIPGKPVITVKIDTVYIDTIIEKPVPYAVYYTGDTSVKDLAGQEFMTADCDSFRFYNDSIATADAKAVVRTLVHGRLLNTHIQLTGINRDTNYSRIDTLKITSNYPYAVTLGLHTVADLNNGFGAGADISLNRFTFAYSYFFSNKSNQIKVGYTLFRK